MNVIQWPEEIPSRFFSGNDQPKPNTETTSFLSGRQVSWQINTKKIMTYKVKLQLTKAELALFWTWFNDVLGQNANARRSGFSQWRLKRYFNDQLTNLLSAFQWRKLC